MGVIILAAAMQVVLTSAGSPALVITSAHEVGISTPVLAETAPAVPLWSDVVVVRRDGRSQKGLLVSRNEREIMLQQGTRYIIIASEDIARIESVRDASRSPRLNGATSGDGLAIGTYEDGFRQGTVDADRVDVSADALAGVALPFGVCAAAMCPVVGDAVINGVIQNSRAPAEDASRWEGYAAGYEAGYAKRRRARRNRAMATGAVTTVVVIGVIALIAAGGDGFALGPATVGGTEKPLPLLIRF